ncbi:MAG: FAD-dependent oxidoreductase [Micromonosporaceae bacterium]
MSGERQADVAVIGGGLGGIAAALAASRAGCSVLLVEPYSRVGGQVTTQAVAALDEHPHIESFGASASYREFRDRVRAGYGGRANPGDGWVSRLCFEPAVGHRVLTTMLDEAGVRVHTGLSAVEVERTGDRITGVRLSDDTVVRADVYCDATEAGDLLPLAGVPWVIGSEGRDAYGESHAVPGGPEPAAQQSFTWCVLVEHRPGEDHTEPEPAGYARWRDRFGFEVEGWDGTVHRYRMFTDGPDGRLPFWTYRRLRTEPPELAVLNWSGNDCWDADPIHDPVRAEALGRELSASFVHWLRTEAPREDGGRGFPGLRVAPEAAGTADGYAEAPYLREARRIAVPHPVTQHDLAVVPGRARAAPQPGSLGVTWYHCDLHARHGHPDSVYTPTAPFAIPAHSLVPEGCGNLLAAGKNLGATQAAATAYRVHHGEWAVGEAAGAAAARCVAEQRPVPAVRDDPGLLARVQYDLAAAGVPLAWIADVPTGTPLFTAAHLLAAYGALDADRAVDLAVRPSEPCTPADARALHDAAADVRTALGLPPRTAPKGAAPDGTATDGTARWQDAATWRELALGMLPELARPTGTPR